MVQGLGFGGIHARAKCINNAYKQKMYHADYCMYNNPRTVKLCSCQSEYMKVLSVKIIYKCTTHRVRDLKFTDLLTNTITVTTTNSIVTGAQTFCTKNTSIE